MSNAVSSSSYGYDALGRITASSQTTGGATYPFQYEYNLQDGLRKMVYPSGRVVTTCYDEAGRARLVHNGALGTVEACDTATTENYAVVAGFTAHGAARDVQLGNLLWERTEYNSRLQATDLRLGTSQGGSDKWRLENGYSLAANNGNVMSQTIGPLNVTQNFQYDGVNRLKIASEGAAWSWTFDYDARGNQWVSEWSGLIPGSFTPTSSSWYEAATNRLTGAPSADYDLAGNQTQIGGYTFGYDAESRVKESTISGATTSYAYDGQGRRVKKAVGSNTTVFVYDAFGQLAAEYGPEESGEPRTRYLTADHLGSTRVVTDANGEVTERHDYRPFGEELFAGVSGRTSDLKYPAADTGVRLKFTGKERDLESGLDYFGARYFSGAQGRFTSPDPKQITARHLSYPQKWNKYVYVQNNPLASIDPDGLDDYKVFAPDTRVKGNWQTARKVAEANGHTFSIYQGEAATVQEFGSALNNPSARVIYVGHTTHDENGTITAIALADGVAAGDTVQRQKPDANFIEVNQKANTVCILACDSSQLRSQYPNASFVGVESGKNHQTSLEAMTPAAHAFVVADAIARPANGNPSKNPIDPVERANDELKAKRRAEDLDGDKVVRR